MLMRPIFAALLLCVLPMLTLVGEETKSRFFKTADGIRIHYLDAGREEPLILVPGWTMPAWIWQKQIDEFSKRYRVIAVDPRSQGESDKPSFGHLPENRAHDYKQLIDQLGLKQPVLVGWSAGAADVMKYVEQFGTSNLRAIVFVDTFFSEKPNPELLLMISGWMNELQLDRRKQANGFIRSMFKKPQPEDYINRLIAASIEVPADTAVASAYDGFAANFSAAFGKIDRPVLFAYQPETQPVADFLKSKLGDKIQLERFDSDGHALFVDNPEKFNRVLEAFLQNLKH
jgi:non-heme chloroperoxidase